MEKKKRRDFFGDYLMPTKRLFYGSQYGRAGQELRERQWAMCGIDNPSSFMPHAASTSPGGIVIPGVEGVNVQHGFFPQLVNLYSTEITDPSNFIVNAVRLSPNTFKAQWSIPVGTLIGNRLFYYSSAIRSNSKAVYCADKILHKGSGDIIGTLPFTSAFNETYSLLDLDADNDHVYAIGGTQDPTYPYLMEIIVVAIDAKTNQIAWRVVMESPAYDFAGNIAVDSGGVYITRDHPTGAYPAPPHIILSKLNKKTGAVIWETSGEDNSFCINNGWWQGQLLSVGKDHIYFSVNVDGSDNYIRAFDKSTGENVSNITTSPAGFAYTVSADENRDELYYGFAENTIYSKSGASFSTGIASIYALAIDPAFIYIGGGWSYDFVCRYEKRKRSDFSLVKTLDRPGVSVFNLYVGK